MAEEIRDKAEDARLENGGADDDSLHEECGVFGVWNVPDAAAVTALMTPASQ